MLFRVDHLNLPGNAWREEFEAAQTRALGGGQRAAWRQPGWVRHEAVLLDSPFSDLHRIGVIEQRLTPAGSLVERALSMSSTTRARLGAAGVTALRQDIGALLDKVSTGGKVTEIVESIALIARRPATSP